MAKKTQQPPPRTFEEALHELEEILQQIEGGSLGLEESLARYERGNFLIQHCRGVLNAAEKQIELISGTSDGGVTTSPLKLREDELPPSDDDTDDDDEAAQAEAERA
jgi:exodeoxyribonuclease VII small subunit